jgi:hypothetical protein
VIVTTESRTAATTSVRSTASGEAEALEPVAAVTAPGVAAGEDVTGASGPVTRAAVPVAASIADRNEAATTDRIRTDRARALFGGASPAGIDGT